MYILNVGLPASMLEKRLGCLFTIMHVYWILYILGLRSSWGTSWVRPAWSLSGLYWLWLCPHFWAPTPEATLLRRRLFVVLMTASHISPNVFSLQVSLTNIYWTSYYNARQCMHTYYTSHSRNAILYYIILHNTLMSISHLNFFCSSW